MKKIKNNLSEYIILRTEMIPKCNRYEINSLKLFKNLISDQI